MDILTPKTIAQILGLTVSGIFTGYTLSLSLTTVPAILSQTSSTTPNANIPKDLSEPLLLSQWRHIFIHGAKVAKPCTVISVLCYGYLAYSSSPGLRAWLYVLAALASGCGPPFALTVLRPTNAALRQRCLKVIGPPPAHLRDPIMAYVNDEYERKVQKDESRSTASLVRDWNWFNWVRSVVMVLGLMVGAYAVVLDA